MNFAKPLKAISAGLLLILLASWAIVSQVRADVSGAGTVIIVNSTEDLANSTNYDNHTCGYTSGAIYFPAGDGKCTLRRAILEAGVRPDGDRPISIQFNIPTSDPNYNASLQVWE